MLNCSNVAAVASSSAATIGCFEDLRVKGILAVATCGLISFIMSSITYVTILGTNKVIKLKYRLVMYLLFSNSLQGLGYVFSLAWLHTVAVPGDPVCNVQSLLFNFSDNCATLWNGLIGFYLFLVTRVTNKDWFPGRKFEICSQVIWIISFFLSGAGLFWHEASDYFVPIYGGSWCWIAPKYEMERLLCLLLWIYVFAVILILLYFSIGYSFFVRKGNLNVETNTLISLLIGFPLVFCFTYLPLGLLRLVTGLLGVEPPLSWLYGTACFFTSEGTFNTFLYGKTRQIFDCWIPKHTPLPPSASGEALSVQTVNASE